MRSFRWGSPAQSLNASVPPLEWVAKSKLGATTVVRVIDDFLFFAHSRAKYEQCVQAFDNLCFELGVLLAPGKTVAPASVITFLGILLDTMLVEADCQRISWRKVRHCWRNFRELQSRYCHTYDSRGPETPSPHQVDSSGKARSTGRSSFFQFNGRSFFLDDNFLTGDHLHLYTDASGSIGFGAMYDAEWFNEQWPV